MDAIKEFLRAVDKLEHGEINIDEYEKLCEPLRDVRENVHGKWIGVNEISREYIGDKCVKISYEYFKCSECGWLKPNDKMKFCENCSADMRGDNDGNC